jgi:hypothetical protein
MNQPRICRRYVLIFIALAAAVLLPVVALNYLLGLRSLGGADVVLEASRWQQATHGVTYAPPLSANRPFKSARLFDRLPEINAIVFGSSTAMGITAEMFPEDIRIYNFAQTGNLLSTVVGEAGFVEKTWSGKIKWLFVPVDWALGSPYFQREPGSESLAPPTSEWNQPSKLALTDRLADTLSLPRVKNLGGIIAGVIRSQEPVKNFRETFLQSASDDYRCADGILAKDFDTIFRGTCTGFRFDGSATFANLEPLSLQRAPVLIAGATVPSSKYAIELIKANGEIYPPLLSRLGEIARSMRQSGGRLILLLPPLLPGMNEALQTAPKTGPPLRRTREILEQWSHQEGVIIIDAGRSEQFGCSVPEFVDEHHALPQCYARIFSRFWREERESKSIRAGLWPAPG